MLFARAQLLLLCTWMQHLDVSHNLYLEVTDWDLLEPIAEKWTQLKHIQATKVLGPYQDFTCQHLDRLADSLRQRHGKDVLVWKPRAADGAAAPRVGR